MYVLYHQSLHKQQLIVHPLHVIPLETCEAHKRFFIVHTLGNNLCVNSTSAL